MFSYETFLFSFFYLAFFNSAYSEINIINVIHTSNNECNGEITILAQGTAAPFIVSLYRIEGVQALLIEEHVGVSGQITFNNTLCAGNFVLYVENAYGCITELETEIVSCNENPININATLTNSCGNQGGTISLDVSGGTSSNYYYSWDNQSASQTITNLSEGIYWSTGDNTSTITVSTPGNYTLSVVDANGCATDASYEITEETVHSIEFTATSTSCFGASDGQIFIEQVNGGEPPYLFTIDNQNFQTSEQFSSLPSGQYSLVIEDFNGCRSSFDMVITEPPQIIIESPDNIQVVVGDSLNLDLETNISNPTIQWTPTEYLSCTTCPNPVITPLQNTVYQIQITDTAGCTEIATLNVQVDKQSQIFVPNIFSPNGDGHNDALEIFPGSGIEQILSFEIFSRWGELVFRQQEVSPVNISTWDGKLKDQPAPTGVYVYRLVYRFFSGEQVEQSGDVLLVR